MFICDLFLVPIEFVDADLIQNPTAGTEARIRCVVTADPPADVTWHKSFQPITDGTVHIPIGSFSSSCFSVFLSI